MAQEPFEPHLRRAEEQFQAGEYQHAGQIWQAILKRDPGHLAAREGLLRVRRALEASAPEPTVSKEELDTLLRQGSQLWDMGVLEEAIEKWEQVLQLDPGNADAHSFITMVNKELDASGRAPISLLGRGPGAAPSPLPRAPRPAPFPAPAPGEEVDALLREASQLWDLGVPDDAIAKWQHVLQLDPRNEEAQAFISRVTREQAEAAATRRVTLPVPEPFPTPVASNEPTSSLPTQLQEGEDPRLRQGEHLLELGRFDEALYSFQQALAQQPDHPRAREGMARAQEGAHPAAHPAARPAPAPPQRVNLPATVTALPHRRLGLEIPEPLLALASHPWVQSPMTWAGALAGIILFAIGLSYWRQAARDRQLKADLNRVLQEALVPAVRASAVVDLEEAPAALLAEARASLSEDPLRAYHRAQEVLRRSPQDPAAAQLLEQARAALAQPEPEPAGDLASRLKAGDLEGALKTVIHQLRAEPEDPKLLRRAASLLGTLAQVQASRGKWGVAKEHLQHARALFPQDRAWNARIYLLDRIPSQPKAEQAGWIALLW